MIVSRIPGINEDLERVREIAPSGFVLALNVGWAGPEFLHSEYPEKWRNIYESKNYFVTDPVFYWTLMNTGRKRWSEVGYPDPLKVSQKAKKFGLVYGAVFSQKVEGKKSFFSAGRSDRELTEPELTELGDFFDKWLTVASERPELSLGELQVMKCLKDGMSQSETAAALSIAESTVKKRAQSVMKKFRASTRAEAVSIAVEKRYFHLE